MARCWTTGVVLTALVACDATPAAPAAEAVPTAGLVLWLDAADESTLAVDGKGLARWRDTSGRGHDLVPPEEAARPALSAALPNGLRPISFDGAAQYLLGPAVLPEAQPAYTIVALWRPRRHGTQSVFEQAVAPLQGNTRAAVLAVGEAYGFNGESNDRHDLVHYEPNEWRLTCLEIDNGRPQNLRLWDNGALYSASTAAPQALRLGAGGVTIGRKLSTPNEFLAGEVAAVLVYERVLAEAERQHLLAHLDAEWGTDVLGWFRAPDGRLLAFDFEGETYGEGWTVEGTAFGSGPARGTLPGQMEVSGFLGRGLVNSFLGGDASTGTLTSPPFVISRRYIRFLIGGGKYPGETCMNLLVDGQVVRTATGPNDQPGGSERLEWAEWEVAEFAGRTATVQIVDRATGGWGHINVDHIIQTDRRLPVLLDQERELIAAKRYLNLPIRDGAPKRRFQVFVDGRAERDVVVPFADETPDYWVFMDLVPFRGKTLRLHVERLPEGSQALAAVEQSDSIKGAEGLYREPLRPQVHFTTRRGWNNDPNGLVYHAGEWHLFYQHNPYSTRWDNMHWGHAVSPDLMHWQELPVALYPDPLGPCFSGSAVVDRQNTAGFQQGAEPAMVCIYTAAGNPVVQCLAYSTDRGRTWAKYAGNPVLGHIIGGNRDPKVLWYAPGNCWIMALFLDANDYGLFSSPDLKRWERLGTVTVPGSSECPEFFEIPVDGTPAETRWVFYGGNGSYLVGRFDGRTFTPESGPHALHHGNCFYASQTFTDAPSDRRVLIAWGTVGMPGMPFNQMMTQPVELTLRGTDEGLRLFVEPVAELAGLHERPIRLGETAVPVGETPVAGVDAETLHLRAEFATGEAASFGLLVRGVGVSYDARAGRLECCGQVAPLKPEDGKVTLEVIVDRTSVEIFANRGRLYLPVGVLAPQKRRDLVLFSREAPTRLVSLEAWPLKPIW
jgi:fructan beta-fructosidase